MIVSTLQEFCNNLTKTRPIISIDYGQKKLGIAISNQEHTIAMPLKIINDPNKLNKIKALGELITAYSVCAIVIGLPISMDGEISEQTKIVQKFAERIATVIKLPIYLQDERLTSKAADSLLKSFGMKRKDRNAKDDAIAAGMILETTLDSLRHSGYCSSE